MTKKKNVLMRSAGLLLVLVLVTSCFVGSTFAKYTVNGTGKDTARVAKFGVTVTAEGTMFAQEYDTDDENVKGTISKSVVSTTNADGKKDKVVAPGTKGNMSSIALAGKPEVAVRVEYKVNTFALAGWQTGDDAATTEYCPLVFTVGDKTYKIGDNGIDTVDELEAAVKNAIEGCSQNYEANTDLSTANVKVPSVGWEWAFQGADNGASTTAYQTDAKDTKLGDRAAEGKAATVTLEIATTVTQID